MMKKHVSNILHADDVPATPDVLAQLQASCSERWRFAAPPATLFRFAAADFNDHTDRFVLALDGGLCAVAAPPECRCPDIGRPAAGCECQPLECPRCAAAFLALTTSCQFDLCLYDECGYCSHYREDCYREELERDLDAAFGDGYAGDSDAERMVAALAEVLGAQSGDAPYFPMVGEYVARRAVDSRLDPDGRLVWTMPDGSTVVSARQVWCVVGDGAPAPAAVR